MRLNDRFQLLNGCRAAMLLAACAVLPLACLPSETEDDRPGTEEEAVTPAEFIQPPQETPAGDAKAATEDLIKEWRALAENPEENQIAIRDIVITEELGKRGPENITPLLDVIDSETAGPEQKVFAMRSLANHIRPVHLDRLKGIVENSTDGTSRACATSLIAHVRGEDMTEYLKGLTDDPEERVAMAATVGLADHGNAEMREQLSGMYWEEGTNDRERQRIVVMLMQDPQPEDFTILSDAMLSETSDPITRQNIIYLFGRIGDASVLPALNECIEKYGSDTSIQSVARAAIQTIEKRSEESGAETAPEAAPESPAATEETPPSGS